MLISQDITKTKRKVSTARRQKAATDMDLESKGLTETTRVRQVAALVRDIILEEGHAPDAACLHVFKAVHVGAFMALGSDTSGVAARIHHAADFGYAIATAMLDGSTLDEEMLAQKLDEHLPRWRSRIWSE